MNKVKIIRNILQTVKQDLKIVLKCWAYLLVILYPASVAVSGVVVFAQLTGLIKLGIWEVTVPFANYWFWGCSVLTFIYHIYSTCSKAFKNQK